MNNNKGTTFAFRVKEYHNMPKKKSILKPSFYSGGMTFLLVLLIISIIEFVDVVSKDKVTVKLFLEPKLTQFLIAAGAGFCTFLAVLLTGVLNQDKIKAVSESDKRLMKVLAVIFISLQIIMLFSIKFG